MNSRLTGILIFLLSALISSVSQILLKKSAMKTYPSRIREYVNLLVVSGYIMLLGCTVLVVLAFRSLPLSLGPILEASAYVYIMVLSSLIFHEKISAKKIVGNILIIVGICVFSLWG